MGEKLFKMPDIYFEAEYGKLSSLIEEEGSESIVYKYKDENGEIYVLFIKRLINIKVDEKQYFDIITPYGYGGPIITKINNDNNDNNNTKENLIKNFRKEFIKYCETNNIVSEFVRFHPILNNALDFKEAYNPEKILRSLITVCNKGRPFDVEFSKSAKKTIRKSLENGVTFETIENPKNISEFKEIYYETMQRNEAKSFYYFQENYFEYLLKAFNENIVLVNVRDKELNIIASGLYFKYKNYLHTHLSGTRTEYLKLSPAYILRYALSEYGFKNGYEYIHHGGGTSVNLDDPLFLFKQRFTKQEPLDYYVAKVIYNQEVYDKLVKLTNTKDSKFFPQYRDTL